MTEIAIQLQNGHSGYSPLRRSSFGKTACQCCPYGYHIDLDFVRFCESMAKDKGDQNPSKRQRKERRRQRQSMEVLLGLTTPVIWNLEHMLPTVSITKFSIAFVISSWRFARLWLFFIGWRNLICHKVICETIFNLWRILLIKVKRL